MKTLVTIVETKSFATRAKDLLSDTQRIDLAKVARTICKTYGAKK